ncbi:BTB/POZ domain-containing protein 7 [Halotydeus destructor]|nr:BTB/POZ domain-containing protein 7 [Halotydeus destructor]
MGASSSLQSQSGSNCDKSNRSGGHKTLFHAHSWSSLNEHLGHEAHFGSVKSEVTAAVKKKRNLASFVTLKTKRLVRRSRRVSKAFDHGQVLREFLTGWSTRDLLLLVEEYEATALLKELSFQAEIARPLASTVARDLSELYDLKYCADAYLIFRGVHFPVHKAIICVRCPFFRELLGKVNTFGARVTVSIDIPGLRPELFNDLLQYLYSGQLQPTIPADASPPPSLPSYDSVLLKLSEQFGVPNDLDHDLKRLLETGLYSDASLVFSSSSAPTPSDYPSTMKKCRACSEQSDFSCHSSVLSARSPFFKNVIQRHQRRLADHNGQNDQPINTANQKMRIVLDESIIPRRFARVILHSMYRDSVDLMTVLPACVCKCQFYADQGGPDGQRGAGSITSLTSSLTGSTTNNSHSSACSIPSLTPSCVSSSSSSTSPACYVKEIMDLFEIARFLELDCLIQSCEDLMIESLSLDTLTGILRWSEQPHGSPWVKRQALHFLKEEFALVASSPVLYNLDHVHLLEAIKSDYVQASELEVLQSLIKWGEFTLMRQMEDREPNIVSQTTHSLRRGLRKREVNDAELRHVLSELMMQVRIGHILPLDSEALTSAVKRGLISTLPPYMLGEDLGIPYVRGISSWLRDRGTRPFVCPRYFTPYIEEAKSYLEDRLGRPGEMMLRREYGSSRVISHVPDTLYMVDSNGDHGNEPIYRSSQSESAYDCCQRDVGAQNGPPDGRSPNSGSQFNSLPVIEQRIMVLMKQREQELKSLAFSNRALLLVCNRQEITRLIQLRAVREFGLPDAALEALANSASYIPYPQTETTDTCTDEMTASYGIVGMMPSSGGRSVEPWL